MIHRRTVEALLAEVPPLGVEISPRERDAVAGDAVLAIIARLREAIRQEIARHVLDPSSERLPPRLRDALSRASLLGIGIIDIPEPQPDAAPLPGQDGYALGVAIYLDSLPTAAAEQVGFVGVLPLQHGGVPVVAYPAEWGRHHHPAGGRCAAVVTDGPDAYLLTARHVVESKPIGAKVALTCGPGCWGHCYGSVAKKGHLYLDVALIRPTQCPLFPLGTSSPVGPAIAVSGATVRHYFGSSTGPVQATVMQAVGTPASFVNAAAPLTFLTDVVGQKGDSGSAITTDGLGPDATRSLIGVYCGGVDVMLPDGTVRRRGYGHDADEAMRLFGITLAGGVYQ